MHQEPSTVDHWNLSRLLGLLYEILLLECKYDYETIISYIDTSVLLENTSLVKLLRNHIREWRIFYILTSEEIDYFIDIKFVLNCT